jgi:phosphoserine phosphatase
MLICSLIAPPGGLSVDMAGNLFSAWGGRELTWLHPREAAEFEIAAMPENRWQVWQDLQEMHVDLVVQPKGGPAQKAAFGRYGQHDDPAGMY